ncbi:MAG: hypothetical protein Q8M16_11640 [Pirellulaceae bacterium]|nr:hypothetical protein [Pirellulaceae bacterium]
MASTAAQRQAQEGGPGAGWQADQIKSCPADQFARRRRGLGDRQDWFRTGGVLRYSSRRRRRDELHHRPVDDPVFRRRPFVATLIGIEHVHVV